MSTASAVDGRSARAQRTRDSVVTAVLELANAGDPRPTAKEIADRAGISVRSVYVHFDDLDDLFQAAAARHFEQMSTLLKPVDGSLALPERIRAATVQRGAIHENFGAVRRAAEQWAPLSPALTEVLRSGREVGRQDIERLFGPILLGRADHEVTLGAINVILGPKVWDDLREQGLSVEAANEIILHTLTRLLAHT